MKICNLVLLIVCCINVSLAQVAVPTPSEPKSPDLMKGLLAETFAKDTFAYFPVPYHLLATFETFSTDGTADGEGSIERFYSSPGHLRTVTRFRDKMMVEYIYGGLPRYTNDGFGGSIMTYFAYQFLLSPLPPPAGTSRSDLETTTRQLDSSVLDCGSYQFYKEPAGFPALPRELYCITRPGIDLALSQTLNFSVRYETRVEFLGRTIAREIDVYEGPVVRCRIHVRQVDQQTLDEKDFAPPSDAVSVKPGPEWRATASTENKPEQHPLPQQLMQVSADHMSDLSEFLILRSPAGKVIDVQPLYAPNAEVRKAGVEALRQWTFPPLLRSGVPVETISGVYLSSSSQ